MTQPPSTSRLRSSHIPALDGWRGVAILAVMAYHLWPWHWTHAAKFTSWGWIGVDLFFVLSGFLITRILLAARDRPHYFRNFFARRTLRIFPLYYAAVLVAAVIWPMLGPAHQPAGVALPHAAIALTYVTNLWQCAHDKWYTVPGSLQVGHFWSLAVEEQFYLVWPIVVLVLADRRWLLAACGAGVAVSVGLRLVFWAAKADHMWAFAFTPCRLDGLCLGAALAVAATDPQWTAVARRLCWVTLALTLPALLAMGIHCRTLNHSEAHLVGTAGLLLTAPLSAAALFLTVAAPAGGLADRLLSVAALRWVGRYSYGLYVYHGLLGTALGDYVDRMAWRQTAQGWSGDLCYFVIVAGASTAVAVASYHLFEQPLLRLKRFFPEPMTPDRTAGPAAPMVVLPSLAAASVA